MLPFRSLWLRPARRQDVTKWLYKERLMKRLLATATLVLLALGPGIAQEPAKAGASKATTGAAQTLIDMENQWVKASKANDGDAIGALLSEDFVTIDSDGSMHGRADVVARAKKAKWTSMEIGDMKVTMH